VGGGTRLKIFEVLAMGQAVVSTTVGPEGPPVVAGHHQLLADDVEDFAHTVASLLWDPARRQHLPRAGRHLVQEHHSWIRVGQEQFEVHGEDILASRRRGGH
jgi:polysaccharide biosynthesis protein PslH